jgi:tetratricopeptide (TPR) repeat protein
MKNRSFLWVILCIVVFICQIYAEVDPFYVETLKEGKDLYHDGRFSEAIESLEIAEFGLYEEKIHLKELYIYVALSYYKLGKMPKVQETMKKMETELKINLVKMADIPTKIQEDIEVMISVTSNKTTGSQKKGKSREKIDLIRSFENIFRQNLESLRNNRFGDVEKGIKKLKKLNKRNVKIHYLKGLLAFRKKKYQDSIVSLKKYYYSNNTQYIEKAIYYISLASYFVNEYGQCLAFYQKIKDPVDQRQMTNIIKKVLSERKTMIQGVVNSFNKNEFKNLVKTFAGDSVIAVDLLKNALDYYQYNNPVILDIIKLCQKRPESYNLDFILTAISYLERVNKISIATKLIVKSKFYKKRDKKHIEMFYQLGLLYFKKQKFDKALVALTIVKNIKPGYNESEKVINEINNKQGGK